MEEPRKRGRPPYRSELVPLHLSIPKDNYAYLTLLAKKGRLGADEASVATHILVRDLDAMFTAGYHNLVVPDD